MKRMALTLLTGLITFIGHAQQENQTGTETSGSDPYVGYVEEAFMDMDFEPNLATPVVPERLKPVVSRHVRSVAEGLKKSLPVELMRDGEVMVVTLAAEDLYLANDTLLAAHSSRQLNKLLPLFADPYQYKVVVSVHTDNTGSREYRDKLSRARLNSLYDWFLDAIDRGEASEDLIFIPFSMDSSDPLVDNRTREHRRRNRRVEFYFIPGPKMITEADSGLLVTPKK